MKLVKRIALYILAALIVAVVATIVHGFATIGFATYLGYYPTERLCASLRPEMELKDAEARIYEIGRPQSINYHSNQLDVFDKDSGCTLEIDPATKRIVKITISGPPVMF